MKRLFIFLPLVLVTIFLLLPQKRLAHQVSAPARAEKEMGLVPGRKVPKASGPLEISRDLKTAPTTQDLMDSFRTKTTNDIRLERARILKLADSRNLYAKANQNSMTASDRDELAYVMRANTALSILLIERELEQN